MTAFALAALWPAGMARAHSPTASCQIVVEQRGTGHVIRGRIASPGPIVGTYELRAFRTSGSNTSSSSQSAGFEARPAVPAETGTLELGGGGEMEITLTARWVGGTASCSRRIFQSL